MKEYKYICTNCGKEVYPSRAVWYRKLKSNNWLCQTCSYRLIGKHSQAVEEGKLKAKKTCLKKYGVDNPAKAKSIQEKTKKTDLEKYGTEYHIASKEVREKIIKTNQNRYGVNCTFEVEEFKEKAKKTLKEKYGKENIAQVDGIMDKVLDTRYDRYGTVTPTSKYSYDNISFDSSWELAFYIFCKDSYIAIERSPQYIPYIRDGQIHRYYPDFKVNNELIEIKGNNLINTNNEILTLNGKIDFEKTEVIRKNNIKIIGPDKIKKYLIYITKKYGKNFLKSFRTC